MATKEYDQLIRAGFSGNFLRTPSGSHPESRKTILEHPEAWRTCIHCADYYADISALNIINKIGNQVENSASEKAGFCSTKCAKKHFGDRYYLDVETINLIGGYEYYLNFGEGDNG